MTKKSVNTLSKVKILIREKEEHCLGEVLVEEMKEERQEHGQHSWMADGLLPKHERGEQTPIASRPGAASASAGVRKSRGGKLSKIKRLLDFQLGLCTSCGLPPPC